MSAPAASASARTAASSAPRTPIRIGRHDTGHFHGGQSCTRPRAPLDRIPRAREACRVPLESDFLVLGSGIAGLTCALECAREGRVVLVTKDRLPESSSQYAQGGIASVWSAEDSFESHAADTLVAGAGLCHT